MHSRHSGNSIVTYILTFILVLFICMSMKSCNRSMADMVYISDGYCYHKDTYIIYEEKRQFGRYYNSTYIPYMDSDGNMYKFNTNTEKWEVIDN